MSNTQGFSARLNYKKPLFVCGWLILYFYVFAVPAYAYLDPGTGSFIFQIMVGAVVGAVFVLKTYFNKIADKARSLFGLSPEETIDKKTGDAPSEDEKDKPK
jgi:glucan phosphoethanolaminetransferase (alkaline phosphatase superfamily)